MYRTSLTRVLLPEPDTPETQTRRPRGILTSTPFRLFSSAPLMTRRLLLACRLRWGTGMVRRPLR